MKVILILGTRPQIIKSTPIISGALKIKELELGIIHTGQHYDYEMSSIFFDEMNLPEPLANLNIGSGSHGQQTGSMLIKIEDVLVQNKPDVVLVPGDTNSTLAGAIAASKLHINLAHLESGARSYDMSMPEEINRRLTDHCSTILFTVSENCRKNLINEGLNSGQIFDVGDTMYDVLQNHLPKIEASKILNKLELYENEYAVITSHRQENVDNREKLIELVTALLHLPSLTFIFPLHPRTKERLLKTGLMAKLVSAQHIKLVPPLGYYEMMKLVKHSKMVLTDSGGMQKEAFWLNIPCITLRENTEWVETVELGVNVLVGMNEYRIHEEVKRVLNGELSNVPFSTHPYGTGDSANKILHILRELR